MIVKSLQCLSCLEKNPIEAQVCGSCGFKFNRKSSRISAKTILIIRILIWGILTTLAVLTALSVYKNYD